MTSVRSPSAPAGRLSCTLRHKGRACFAIASLCSGTQDLRSERWLLSAGQPQNEIFVNESLQTLDSLVAGSVEKPPRNHPPSAPAIGACYIVGAAPTGAWAGNPLSIAAYTNAGWRFVAPAEGMSFYVRSDATTAAYRTGVWELGKVRASAVTIGGQ